jgi:hypothetical protein
MLSIIARRWKLILVTAVVTLALAFLGLSVFIGGQVSDVVETAQISFPGDPVMALIAVVGDPGSSLARKNQAVWAMGQLGDERALIKLEPCITGQECDHSHEICQDELEKAIHLCKGGWNPGAMIWRHGDLAAR